jgi:hypothetical protein
LSFQASPSLVAVIVTAASSQRPLGSVYASVAMVSPDAMPGRYSALAASSPEWMSVWPASTTVEK